MNFWSKFTGISAILILLISACTTVSNPPLPLPDYSVKSLHSSNFAGLALSCVTREYPNKISHILQSKADALTPKELHPAFYGCYDWHSSVHGHWLLVRLLRFEPKARFAPAIIAALNQNLTQENIKREVAYLSGEGRTGFEVPYGLVWVLQLAAELREWDDPNAKKWLSALTPLETMAAVRLKQWAPNLTYPVRAGTHRSTAFSFSLAYDWALIAKDTKMQQLIYEKSVLFYAQDKNCPLNFEPSGEDFFSPCLMEADLMRRVLTQEQFVIWLSRFLPQIPKTNNASWLVPGKVLDPSDNKLIHLEGLNLSRAWNLEMIALSLPTNDRRRNALLIAANAHRQSSLSNLAAQHYSGAHWLGSFATYLSTGRGLRQ